MITSRTVSRLGSLVIAGLIVSLSLGGVWAQDESPTEAPESTATQVPGAILTPALTLTETATAAPNVTAPPAATATSTPGPNITPADVPDYVLFHPSEFIFPVGLWFNLVMEPPPTAFSSITLRLSQPGWSGRVIDVSIEENTSSETAFTDLTYVWPLPNEDPPSFFQQINYTWTLALEGRQDSFAGSILLADPRTSWAVGRGPDAPLTLALPARGVNAQRSAETMADVYALMRQQTNRRPSLQLVFLDGSLPDPCPPQGALRAVGVESGTEVACTQSADALYAAAGYTPVRVPLIAAEPVLEAATFEIFNLMYGPLLDEGSVPDWFRYGLGLFYAPTDKTDQLDLMRAARRTDRLYREMPPEPAADSAELPLWRAQSYGMVLYIAEQIGVDGLFDLAGDLAGGANFAQAYQSAVEGPVSGLIPAWSEWIFGVGAVSAYGYNPYLPETPTPSVTPSRTFTPTATASLTATPTITPTDTLTPTVTGTLSVTPRPTNTATITPTPTRTLIPADFIVTVTPLPVAPPPVEAAPPPDSTLSILLIGGAVVIALILIAAALLSPRRGDQG